METRGGSFGRAIPALILLAAALAACSAGGEPERQEEIVAAEQESATATVEPPSPTPESPTLTPEPPTQTVEPEPPTPTPVPTETATPEPTVILSPIIPIGSTADFSGSDDALGIGGLAEVIEVNKIRIRDFVSPSGVAPGVDIRLGQGADFTDEVAVILRDITGDNYEGRSLTLTIPNEAYDGRTFNSIAIYCFDTGEIFDWVVFE